jgi:transposase
VAGRATEAVRGKGESIPSSRQVIRALREEVARLQAQVADLLALVARQQARIEILERTSGSGPSGPPLAAPAAEPPAAPKPRGRPEGHPGTSWSRPAVEPTVVPLALDACPDCGGELSEWRDWQDHWVVDLPEPTPVTLTNFRHQRGYCPRCKKTVRAPRAPEEPPRGHLGLRLLSLAAELKSGFGLPFTKVSGLLQRLFQVEVPRATLPSLVQRVGEWLKPARDALLEVVKAAAVKHADETSWPVSGKNGWAWAFATQEVAVFLMEPTRSAKVPQAVLGKDLGHVLVVDDYPGYLSLPHERQACWAHLLREAEIAAALKPLPSAIALRKRLKEIFGEAEIVAQARETLTPRQLDLEIERIDRMLIDVCRWRTRCHEVRHVQKRVARRRRELLTFLRRPGVDPTNNRGERVIRPLVLVRKVSGGSRSWTGARVHGAIASCIQSLQHFSTSFTDLVRRHVTLPELRPQLTSVLSA